MRPFLQQEQLCFNTLNVLHIRQAAYGIKQPSVSQKQTADWGWKKIGEQWGLFWTANAPVAQSCEQLSVAANQSAVEDANVLDWGSLAQNCAIANVNKKISRGGIGYHF